MTTRIQFLGAQIDPLTMAETVKTIGSRIEQNRFTQHVVINVAKLVAMRSDGTLRKAIEGCEIINADGMGVVWGAKALGISIPERVAGVDLFFELLTLASMRRYPVYILGARPGVIEKAVEQLRAMYPELVIAGYHHGYFWDDEPAMVEEIARSGATMLFVAITSPKKEQFVARYRERLGTKFVMGVGGTIDVIAGVTKRAPLWMQRAGLEWFFRLLQEPRRMWKRYLVSNTVFAFLLLEERARALMRRLREKRPSV